MTVTTPKNIPVQGKVKAVVPSNSATSKNIYNGVIQYQFPTPQLEWVIHHNKNTTKFVESVMSSDGNRIYSAVHVIDSNSFVIYLTSATAGYVNVAF